MNLQYALMGQEYAGLAWQFHVSPSSCDNPSHYEEYVRFCAVTDRNDGRTVTHLLLDGDANRIAGYIALRTGSMLTVGEDGKFVGIPALEIAEIAVDQDYERNNVGTLLVNIALDAAGYLRNTLAGVMYIVACADPASVDFYRKQGFDAAKDNYTVPSDGWNNNCSPFYLRL